MSDNPHPKDDPATLFADVATSLGRLVRGELAMAKAEAQHGLRNAGAGVVKALAAVVFGLVGLNVLAGAAVAALAETGIGVGPAGLIVALVFLAGALVLALMARSAFRMKEFLPDRAFRGLQQDVQALKAGLMRKETRHV